MREPAATLELLAAEVQPDEPRRLSLTNTDEIFVCFGFARAIYRDTGEGWKQVAPGAPFRAVGLGLAPGESLDLPLAMPEANPPRNYRLHKRVGPIHREENVRLHVDLHAEEA